MARTEGAAVPRLTRHGRFRRTELLASTHLHQAGVRILDRTGQRRSNKLRSRLVASWAWPQGCYWNWGFPFAAPFMYTESGARTAMRVRRCLFARRPHEAQVTPGELGRVRMDVPKVQTHVLGTGARHLRPDVPEHMQGGFADTPRSPGCPAITWVERGRSKRTLGPETISTTKTEFAR